VGDLGCAMNQIIKWVGKQWACADEAAVPHSYLHRLLMSTKIAFSSNRGGNWEIYVMHADGSNPTNLTNHPNDDRDPAWSPVGSRIAFSSYRDGNSEIYVMHADGSDPTNLTNHSKGDYGPAWSPDGSKIAFTSERAWDGPYDIWVMHADGSDPTNLTNNPSGHDHKPAW
jgi:Tol biopolymer transport system component